MVAYAFSLIRRLGSGLGKKRSAVKKNGKTFENNRYQGLESTGTGRFRFPVSLGTRGDDHGDSGTEVGFIVG